MSDSESDPGDRAMFWVNLVGVSLATGLLGTFFCFYDGAGLLALLVLMLGGGPNLPDR